MLALGPMRFLSTAEPLCGGTRELRVEWSSSEMFDAGVSALEAAFESPSPCSSSSTPNDNFPFATAFRFFFGGGPWGVETLCFDRQSPWRVPALFGKDKAK